MQLVVAGTVAGIVGIVVEIAEIVKIVAGGSEIVARIVAATLHLLVDTQAAGVHLSL